MKNIILSILLILSGLMLSQCKKDAAGISSITVQMKDAPASFDHVFIEVIGVQIHTEHSGWIQIPVHDSIYDLLSLQNNASVLLGALQFPEGTISQVRLILGTNNNVVVSGISFPLSLSSEDESGLKLNLHQEALAGINYVLMLDFIVSQSIVENGNGHYKLKPVISASFQ